MDNQESLATFGTQHTNKTTTQHRATLKEIIVTKLAN